MSKTIDEKVVEMKFDNKNFESNVKTTMSTLDKLKESLKFKDADKGLSGITAAAKNCDMSSLSNSVETVRSRFSALEVMGVTALANITNSAVNAGKRMLSALTIDPIKTGFSEYELKMGSIQTIMAGTGESLETVNKYLNDLNTYSDKTIYSFSDMTSNIGKFTNAGVKLKDAVSAIQGVSNVAAVSGANAGEASRAMYNFAQALSSGYVKLIDWKSIENSNMATVEFKNQLLETAAAEGTLTKAADGTYKTLEKGTVVSATHNFNDALQEQWMTSDVLIKTLSEYADETTEIGKKAFAAAQDVKTFSQLWDTLKESAQSGWATTWELIVGDFEEAKTLLTEINKVVSQMISDSADFRNNLLTGWKELGGRSVLIEAMRNAFEGLMKVVKAVKGAFNEVFPPMTAKQLTNFTLDLNRLILKFKMSDSTAENLKKTMKGVFSILKIGVDLLKGVIKVAGNVLDIILPLGSGFLSITGALGDMSSGLVSATKEGGAFSKAFGRVSDVIEKFADKVKSGVDAIKKAISSLSVGKDSVEGLTEKVSVLEIIGKALSAFGLLIGSVFKKASSLMSPFFNTLKNGLSSMDFSGLAVLLNGGMLAAITTSLMKFVKSLRSITDGAGSFLKGLTSIFDGVRGCLEAYQSKLKAGVLIQIAAAVAILAGALIAMSFIDPGKMAGAVAAIGALMAELLISINSFGNLTKLPGFKSMIKITGAMMGMATALLILSFAVKTIGSLDFNQLINGLVGVAGMAGILLAASKKLTTGAKGMIRSTVGLVIFAAAVRILVESVKELGNMDFGAIAQGLVGVGLICTEIQLFLKKANIDKTGLKSGTGMLMLAVSIKVLVSALKTLGDMDPGKMILGLTGLGVVLGELVLFSKFVSGSSEVLSASAALLVLGGALILISTALRIIGDMNPDQIALAFTTFTGVMVELVAALHMMPKNLSSMGLGLMGVATAMLILSVALKIMGSMSWDEVGKGLVVLAGSLFILDIALKYMQADLAGAGALVIISAALIGLAIAMKIMGSMQPDEILRSMVMLAGSLTILGVAAQFLQPLIPAMLMLGAAMIVAGIGLAAIGAAAIVMAIGLGALMAVGYAGIGVLLALAAAALVVAVASPVLVIAGAALLIFAAGLAAAGLALTLFGSGLSLVASIGPSGSQAFTTIIATALQLAPVTPLILAAGAALIVFGAGAIVAGAGAIVAGAGLLMLGIGLKMLEGIDFTQFTGVNDMATDFLKASGKLLLATPGLLAGGAALIVFGAGIAATSSGLSGINTALIANVSQLSSIPNTISGLTSTISSSFKKMTDSSLAAINSRKKDFQSSGENLVNGFIIGINAKSAYASAAAAKMARDSLVAANKALDVESPSKEFEKTGMYVDMGFANGLKKYSSLAVDASKSLGKSALEPVKTMTDGLVSGTGDVSKTLKSLSFGSASISPVVQTNRTTTVRHTFGKLTVEGVDNKGQFVASADYAVEEVLADMMRRQSRR